MTQERLSKKYIKRLFHKPWKVKCRDCQEKMFMLPEDENPGKILFRCVGSKCGHVIDVTEYKDKYSLNKTKMHKSVIPDNANLISLTRTLTHYRIQDKWYIIDNETTYNPIKKIKYKDKMQIKVSDDVHEGLLEIIINSFKDAPKQ